MKIYAAFLFALWTIGTWGTAAFAFEEIQLLSVSSRPFSISTPTNTNVAVLGRIGNQVSVGIMLNMAQMLDTDLIFGAWESRLCYGLCAGPPNWSTCTDWVVDAYRGGAQGPLTLSSGTWCIQSQLRVTWPFTENFVSSGDGGPDGSCSIVVP